VSDEADGADSRGLTQRFCVELVGLPGAGKSRLARTLTEGLTRRGISVTQPQASLGPSVPTGRRLARKAVASGATALAAPVTTARVVRGVVRSGQPTRADLAKRVVQWLVAQEAMARAARHAGPSIVDEGLVQALWSTGLRGDVEPVLAVLDRSRRWFSPDLLVVVTVPPELALSRLVARSSQHSRTQLLPEHERLVELERGARLLDRLVDWWGSGRANRSREVLVVNGTEDDAGGHTLLLERLSASIGARRPPRSE
jgi:thymidylate kinase